MGATTVTTDDAGLRAHLRENWDKAGGFRSVPHYFPEGDYLTMFFEQRIPCAQRVDDLLTIYRSEDGQQDLVGFKIKGVSQLAQKASAFVSVQYEQMELGLLLLSATGNEPPEGYYYELGKRIQGVSFDASEIMRVAGLVDRGTSAASLRPTGSPPPSARRR